ncbi:hypothetical protein TWF506_006969 [Arthrobotrys conoides]|uniref:Uncharacterized protein n=1 Tax=Arthrobotrys conoides TaxID=74498 RepID=A0AAN8NHP8_9PEZI
MKFLAIAAVALGFAGSGLAAPRPEAASPETAAPPQGTKCETPVVVTVTAKLSPVHVDYRKIIPEVSRIDCKGCPLEIKTVTETHPNWRGKITRNVTHEEKHVPVYMCEVIVAIPEVTGVNVEGNDTKKDN